LFENQGRLVYGLFGAMIMANFINLWMGQLGLRLWVKVVSAPESIIFSSALLLCIVGVSMATGGLFGVGVMLVAAALGYVLSSLGFSLVILIIAFFLGPQFERSLSQSLAITNGDLTRMIHHPVAVALLVMSVVAVAWFLTRPEDLSPAAPGSIED
jgi:putative tricarboxylic transport membrane protein